MPREQATAVADYEITHVHTKPRNACRTPGHQNRQVQARGVCRSCYQSALKLVKDGDKTWKQLEDRGKVLPTAGIKNWLLD